MKVVNTLLPNLQEIPHRWNMMTKCQIVSILKVYAGILQFNQSAYYYFKKTEGEFLIY